jgi:ribosomal protein S27E
MEKEWMSPTLEEKLEAEMLSKIRDKKLGFVHREKAILVDKKMVIPIQKDTNDLPMLEEKLEAAMLSKIRDKKLGFVHIPIYKGATVRSDKKIITTFDKEVVTIFRKARIIPNRENMIASFSKNLPKIKCPSCDSNETIILSILRNGSRCKCEDCGETFVEWSKGINYIGNDEFNTWYGVNKTDLYNIAEKLVTEIGDALSQKDYSGDYKIVATNIIIENMESLCTKLGIKDSEEEISAKLKYKT